MGTGTAQGAWLQHRAPRRDGALIPQKSKRKQLERVAHPATSNHLGSKRVVPDTIANEYRPASTDYGERCPES